ncbi:hypothetical protein VNO80_10249 [Phaseolus coccineus]|uniref:Cytochrome P450 n=1 Tax=Phaseolus coccineus TaxID=3886 RepID=A0AAN9RAA6_PHACN
MVLRPPPPLKFHKLAQLYGPIYKLTLGTKTIVLFSSPSVVKEIVRDQDTIFANRDPLISASVALYGSTDKPICLTVHSGGRLA